MKINPPESWYSAKIGSKGYKNPSSRSHRMNGLRKAFYEAKAKADAAAAAELLKNISENDSGDYLAVEAKAAAYDDNDDDDELLELLGIGAPENEENENNYGVPVSGLKLIKESEGFRANAYKDPLSGNLPITIGWGSTVKKDGSHFKLGDVVTPKEADDLLAYQCKEKYLPSISKIPYWNEMSDGKKGALLSFAYNLGAGFYGSSNFGTITRVLKNKEWDKVPAALYLYRNPGSKVEAGLAKRRTAEGDSWKT